MDFNPDACGVVDQSIPQWKRELIIRRRALGRTLQVGSSSVKLTCPAVVAVVRQPELLSVSEDITSNTQKCSPTLEEPPYSSLNQNRVDFHPSTSSAGSVSNMRLLDACSEVNNLVINGLDTKNKQSGVVTNNDSCVNYNLIMGEDKSLNLKKKGVSSRSKMDQNNCSVINRHTCLIEKVSNEGTNRKSSKDEDCLSDSSEELQYGPGIVNKLKTKYLSMTLREQKRHIRPSIANLRRATSLENMLEGDGNLNKQNTNVIEPKVKTENLIASDRSVLTGKSPGVNLNRVVRNMGNSRVETMKRAQSMDTLLKSEVRATLKPIVNENIVIVEKENLGTNPTDKKAHLRRDVNTDLPPPDLVKQALKIFETSPKKKLKPPSQTNLAKLVAGFSSSASQPVSYNGSQSIDRRKICQNKPTLSPKPVLSPEKLKRARVSSPKKTLPLSGSAPPNRIQSQTNRPLNIEKPKPQVRKNDSNDVERKAVLTSSNVLSPRSISPVVTVLTNNEQTSSVSQATIMSLELNGERESSLEPSEEFEEVDGGESLKPVPESALENIRRGGSSMQFSFDSENTKTSLNKSYLPRPKSPPQALNTSLKEKLEKSPPPTNVVAPRQQTSPQTKQVGIIRPLVATKIQASTPALTEQEIEKNLINRVKSIEQPISKVVVAIKTLPDSVVLGSVSSEMVTNKTLSLPQVCANSKVKTQGLWDEKLWHQNQNTIVFNFSNRKEVPDYIENDGLILKGKRERPMPGEGGIILLDGSADESSTEAEDFLTSSPPSPCDVTFVGDNVLINGKSNLKKSPKQVKLRIQFNDEATTMFEYPSEASLVEEEISEVMVTGKIGEEGGSSSGSQASVTPPAPSSSLASGTPGLGVSLGVPPPDYLPPPVPSKPPLPPPPDAQCPSLPPPRSVGGSLGAYTPRQVAAGDWQLGMTPVQPPPALSPTSTATTTSTEEDHFKPAPPEATIAWSEDTASDLLF